MINIINEPKFDLVINESIKDVNRLYKLEEITDEIFLPYFEHNLDVFGYGELIAEGGLKDVWDAAKQKRFTPRGKNLIVGRDTNLTDASKWAGKKTWEGTKKASSWIADKWKERQAAKSGNINYPQSPTSGTNQQSTLNKIKNTVSSGLAAKSKMVNGVLQYNKSAPQAAKNLRYVGQPKFTLTTT